MSAALVQNVVYYAQGHQRVNTKIVAGIFVSDPIQPRASTSWTPGDILKIPPTEITMVTCRIIKIIYHLKITAVIPRATNSSIDVPIVIGNVPLSDNQTAAPVPLLVLGRASATHPHALPQPTDPPPPYVP